MADRGRRNRGRCKEIRVTDSLLTGTNLSNVNVTLSYNPFAEPSAYEATVSGSAAFRQQYTRDNLGRITTKTETNQGVTDTYGYT